MLTGVREAIHDRVLESAIRRQFHAAIDMLGNGGGCPILCGQVRGEALFVSGVSCAFFLDLYLSSEDESRFRPPAPFV